MNLPGKKVMVTGAAGTLGSHVVRELLTRGAQPVAHVRAESDTDALDRLGIEKRMADLRDGPALCRAAEGVDAIIHCAAWVDFRADRLTQFAGINTMGAVLMFEAARRAGVPRFVHVSSVGAVGARSRKDAPAGARDMEPVNENQQFNLDHLRIPYIMTKRAAERELLTAAAHAGSPSLVIVNPSIILSGATGGPGNLRVHRHFRRLWLPDFPNLVNIVDVRDVAAGVVAALEHGRPGERYILGGDDIPARELVLQVSHVLGRTPHLVRIPRTIIGIAARVAELWCRFAGRSRINFYPDLVRLLDYDWCFSSAKARAELGYRPRALLISLEDYLSETM